MRTDANLVENVRRQSAWTQKTHAGEIDDPINQSFSGEERNRWFHNRPKQDVETGQRDLIDQSMLSGLDSIADGRAFAIGDFNRDGRPDIALCNANAPLLQIFENQIESPNNFIALHFEGGARKDASKKTQDKAGHSCRDGYGATVKLTLDNGSTILREFRCGEGFAAQNSDTMLVGIGDCKAVEQVEVTWPSGNKQQVGPIQIGQAQTLSEAADRQPAPVGYVIEQIAK